MAKNIDGLSKQSKTEEVAEVTQAENTTEATTEKTEVSTEKAVEESTAKASEPEKGEEVTIEPEKGEEKPVEEQVSAQPESTPSAPVKAESFDLFPEPSVVVSGPPTWLWWLLLVVGASALGFLAFDLTRGRIDGWLASDTPTSSPTASPTASTSPEASTSPTAAASPTPTASTTSSTFDKSKVTLRVLNGTTQAGAAASTKTKLEAAGFTVKSIGNAKNQNYTKSYVYYQAGKKAEAEAVFAALTDSSALLEESTLASPDMVLVVFGK
jgi:hypothetical protein